MFALVDDVERYPEFLPWCPWHAGDRAHGGAHAGANRHRLPRARRATSRRSTGSRPPERMDLELVEGPVRALPRRLAIRRRWAMRAAAWSSRSTTRSRAWRLEAVLRPVLGHIIETLVDRFVAPRPGDRMMRDAQVAIALPCAPGSRRGRACPRARRWRTRSPRRKSRRASAGIDLGTVDGRHLVAAPRGSRCGAARRRPRGALSGAQGRSEGSAPAPRAPSGLRLDLEAGLDPVGALADDAVQPDRYCAPPAREREALVGAEIADAHAGSNRACRSCPRPGR